MNEPLDEEAPMTGEGVLTLPQTLSLRTEDIRRGRRGVEDVVTDLDGKLRAAGVLCLSLGEFEAGC